MGTRPALLRVTTLVTHTVMVLVMVMDPDLDLGTEDTRTGMGMEVEMDPLGVCRVRGIDSVYMVSLRPKVVEWSSQSHPPNLPVGINLPFRPVRWPIRLTSSLLHAATRNVTRVTERD